MNSSMAETKRVEANKTGTIATSETRDLTPQSKPFDGACRQSSNPAPKPSASSAAEVGLGAGLAGERVCRVGFSGAAAGRSVRAGAGRSAAGRSARVEGRSAAAALGLAVRGSGLEAGSRRFAGVRGAAGDFASAGGRDAGGFSAAFRGMYDGISSSKSAKSSSNSRPKRGRSSSSAWTVGANGMGGGTLAGIGRASEGACGINGGFGGSVTMRQGGCGPSGGGIGSLRRDGGPKPGCGWGGRIGSAGGKAAGVRGIGGRPRSAGGKAGRFTIGNAEPLPAPPLPPPPPPPLRRGSEPNRVTT